MTLRQIWNKIGEAKHSNRIIAICTTGIFIATFAYCVVSIFQWRAISDANRINLESVQAVQRAFVTGGSSSSLIPVLVGGAKRKKVPYLTVNASWENSGSTPAVDALCNFFVDELPTAPEGRVFFGEGRIGPITNYRTYIGPKGRIGQANMKPLSFFTEGRSLADVGLPTRPKFLWGWIIYRDVFPETKLHITEFCQQLASIALPTDA